MNCIWWRETLREVLQNREETGNSSRAAPSRKGHQHRESKACRHLQNEEINTIIHAIGGGVGADFEIDDINYDKIIIMTDADTDGAHIQVLLLTFSTAI